jgi:hypothetical protein
MVGIYKTEIEQNKIEIDEELNYNTTKKLKRRTITTTTTTHSVMTNL